MSIKGNTSTIKGYVGTGSGLVSGAGSISTALRAEPGGTVYLAIGPTSIVAATSTGTTTTGTASATVAFSAPIVTADQVRSVSDSSGDMIIRSRGHGSNLLLQAENLAGTIKTVVTIDPDADTLTVAGAISGSNLSGTNTGDQTITLTGDVTGSGTGSFATTIANDAVESGMLNDNVISGQTALTSGLASTDELFVSDAGVLKRMDTSVLQTYMQNNLTFTGAGLTNYVKTDTNTDVSANTEWQDGFKAQFGNSADLSIYSSGVGGIIESTGVITIDAGANLLTVSNVTDKGGMWVFGETGLIGDLISSSSWRPASGSTSGVQWNDPNEIEFKIVANTRLKVNTNGIEVNGQLNLTSLNTAPSSATATGTRGEVRFTASHIYVCVATDAWKRASIATW
jgi:hypothetical protein